MPPDDAGRAPRSAGGRSLRIALVAPPVETVPPRRYGGSERVVAALADELHRRGHLVTLFASGDSRVACELVPTVEAALWAHGHQGDIAPFVASSLGKVWREHHRFDVIHSHVDAAGFLFARHCPTPVLTTLHGRLDHSGMPELLAEFPDIPLVAISESQRRWSPRSDWRAVIHHGLALHRAPHAPGPGDSLALVGRMSPEKGIAEGVELAQRTGRKVRIAAKVRERSEHEYFDRVLRPALERDQVEFLGELEEPERDVLYAGALATLALGAWPEPFGLVAIESLATGTPVIARRAGALPELVEHGVDGFLVDDLTEAELAVELVPGLDRALIRRRALSRFSATRMADEYETVYRQLIADRGPRPRPLVPGTAVGPRRPIAAPTASEIDVTPSTDGVRVGGSRWTDS